MDRNTSETVDNSSHHKFFSLIPNIIFKMHLTPQVLAVYLVLKVYAGNKNQSWPSNKQIAYEAAVSERWVRKAKKILQEKKLIRLTKRKDSKGSNETDLIEILDIWEENNDYFYEEKIRIKQSKGVGANLPEGVDANLPHPGCQFADNKDILNKIHVKEDKKAKTDSFRMPSPSASAINSSSKFKKKERIGVRDNVKLTEKQISKLKSKYSEDDVNNIFNILSEYKKSSGRKYSSDYLAITKWVIPIALPNQKATEKLIEEHKIFARELYARLERTGVRGNPKILEDKFIDLLHNKECEYSHPLFKKIVLSWYKI